MNARSFVAVVRGMSYNEGAPRVWGKGVKTLMKIRRSLTGLLLTAALLSSCAPIQQNEAGTSPSLSSMEPPTQTALKKKLKVDHIVVVVEENHSYRQIAGHKDAPYMNALMKNGATLVNHFATRHPSQPNYYDLFSGSTQGITSNKKPLKKFSTPNLASELIKAGFTFGGYSENLPKTGFDGVTDSKFKYARKHNPWVNFTNVPTSANMPFTSFPKDFSKLPTVSFVVPNMDHDIHDGTIKQADDWLKQNLSGYVKWAETHNSLLILTWDEDDMSAKNRIPTVFVGPMVKKGAYSPKSDHFSVLRTIEDLYGLPALGESKKAKALPVFKS
jgi:phospholipase C